MPRTYQCELSLRLQEVLATGKRLTRVVGTTEGEMEKKDRREGEKNYRRYRRENVQRKQGELENEEEESGSQT